MRQNKIITYKDDVFIKNYNITDTTILQTKDRYHQILNKENLKPAPDKSFFFLKSVIILRHQIKMITFTHLIQKLTDF